ncbi:unnamed protein product [Coccothraustes coccothraustes]
MRQIRLPGGGAAARAGQGPAPPPQVRRGWARRSRTPAVPRSSLAAPRSSVQQAPGGGPGAARRGGIPTQGRARPLPWRLGGGPRPPVPALRYRRSPEPGPLPLSGEAL